MIAFYVTQFNRGESVDSEQRMLLPVTKDRTSHSCSDLGSEEEVQLLADHHHPLHKIGYVATLLCSPANCTLNRIILSVCNFIFFVSGNHCEMTHRYLRLNLYEIQVKMARC